MKDKGIFISLILAAPVAFVLSFIVWTFLGVHDAEPIYYVLTFGSTYYVLAVLGFFIDDWLSKGGTVRDQIRKTFRLKKLDIKKSGVAEFFQTDFTIPERLAILIFLIALTISLGTWIFSGLIESMLSRRVMFTFIAFIGSSFGIWYLTADISIRFYKERSIQATGNLETLDLESSGLTEFDFKDIENLDQLQRINLGTNELRAIDLTPLTGRANLVELILYFNRLEAIDLAPLASCKNLEYLDLAVNNIGSVDLTPLSSCKNLNALNLGGCKTGSIDLEPLSRLRKLKILTIDDMGLKEIDLEPLRKCKKLEFLKLNDNEVKSLDITPLYECRELTDFEIDNIELTTTLDVDIETWPTGIRKHKKKIRILDGI